MKTKTRRILESRLRKLQSKLNRSGDLPERQRGQLASIERRLTHDREERATETAFNHAISKGE
jgi:septal ring factor EnvC (AmiA/AmiB activator)